MQSVVMFNFTACVDPLTKKMVAGEKGLNDRKMQGALMWFFKVENYFELLEAIVQTKRAGLTGGCGDEIPPHPL